ncbi:AMP-binding protein [Fodinisporobacter ferrooxydans]|uniref:AMP-binding protein n=1 Tax=Fodinisporobacter ferrooxydans TaxID=2901836 RepID=A0ABY4CPW4_9BACL|nr:AMP-binding protein [Alicyclobacillaceae bacterium MYW30-H2]
MSSFYANKPWLKQYADYVPSEFAIPQKSMIDIFEEVAAARPDAPAIHYFHDTISYGTLNEWADRFSSLLAENGVGKGDRVAVYTQNNPHFLIVVYGAWKRGAIVVPLNPMFKEKELKYHLNDSAAKVLVALDSLYEQFGRSVVPNTQVQVVVTCHESDFVSDISAVPMLEKTRKLPVTDTIDMITTLSEIQVDAVGRDRVAVEPGDIALLVYTSGTTGQPKGAMNLHSNLAFNAEVYQRWMQLEENDKVLGIAPLFHITGIVAHMCVAPLAGIPIVLLHRFDPEAVLNFTEKWQPTMTVGSITAYIALMNTPSAAIRNFRSMVKCYSGGAPIPPSIVENFQKKMGPYIHNVYGLTESNSPLTAAPFGVAAPVDKASGALSVGVPIPNCEVRILALEDPNKEAGVGEEGQLAAKGPMIFAGYWNKPEATEKAFHDGFFLTGDVAVMDENGYLYIVDRKKDMIIVSGFKVWPREVEDVLYQHPAVKEAAVVGVPDPYRGETVKAFVSIKDEYLGNVMAEEIKQFCKERLAAYKYPRMVEILDQIPKTTSGKFLRRELRDRTVNQ